MKQNVEFICKCDCWQRGKAEEGNVVYCPKCKSGYLIVRNPVSGFLEPKRVKIEAK